MPRQAIPDVIKREHVRTALRQLRAGVTHDFGSPRTWEVVDDTGNRFAPKAVIGLAHEAATGVRLHPDDFSSGEAKGQAVGYLRALGFKVRRIGS